MHDNARVEVPATLRQGIEQAFGSAGQEWCDGLPALVADLMSEWGLTRTAEEPRSGFGGVAVPLTRTDRSGAILKVTFSSKTRDDENEVLAAWAGRRAVRLLERDDTRHARLLERLGDESLFDLADPVRAMSVAGSLAADLAVKPPPGLQRMADVASSLATQISESDKHTHRKLTVRSVEAAAATFRELSSDQPDTLLHGDLQGRNMCERLTVTEPPWNRGAEAVR